jgi:hypothetical protein
MSDQIVRIDYLEQWIEQVESLQIEDIGRKNRPKKSEQYLPIICSSFRRETLFRLN